ncbi:MAG TPA: hypothetical protein VF787_27455 [Thermoanaerobaculia bacterium]
MKWLWGALVALAIVYAAALLHRGQPIGWDELEFFRATKWTAEGRAPFAGFWEHHTPLQWFVFAPVAYLIDSPGAIAIVTMRWAQAAMWIATFALVLLIARRANLSMTSRWAAVALLLAAPSFLKFAVEYRVDALGNFLFIAAIALAMSRPRWIAFGALMSLAVLANMRLAPLVIVAAVLFFYRDRRAWRMAGGVAIVAAAFGAWILASGAWPGLIEGIVRYNSDFSKMLKVDTFFVTLLAPVWARDVAAIALWLSAIGGAILGWRIPSIRDLAILSAASVVTVATMVVQYEYHFQTTYLLMVPLAAFAFDRVAERWRVLIPAVAAVAIVINLVGLLSPAFGNEMRYQDAVMREADRRTLPREVVWDGSGYALRREPAYRWWFLPTGVRMLASVGKIPAYDIARNPPAAIIYNLRLQRWFEIFPNVASYATHHYIPLYRDLWIPALSGAIPPNRRAAWVVPRDGRYRLIASGALMRHPWFTKPLDYASVNGPLAAQYAIPLRALPPSADIAWTIDGRAVTASVVDLKKGVRVAASSSATVPIGVIVVAADVTVLCVGPPEDFLF